MDKELYIFSGLGADERLFEKLDFSSFSVTHVDWITPLKQESIEAYAKRLLDQIKSKKPILLGLSFGGIMAIEISKQIETTKIILLASVKTKKEIPFYMRFAGKLSIHKIIPARFMRHSNFFVNWIFGAETPDDKQLLKQILIDTDPKFLKWAIDKIVNWKNQYGPKNLIHIHGTKDRLFPLPFTKPDITIQKGGHFMTNNRPEELSEIIRTQL